MFQAIPINHLGCQTVPMAKALGKREGSPDKKPDTNLETGCGPEVLEPARWRAARAHKGHPSAPRRINGAETPPAAEC